LIVTQKDRYTSKKTRIISSNQQILRFDKESKDDILRQSEDEIISNLRDDYDVILLSDYAKGVLTKRLTKKIIDNPQ